MDRFWRFIFFSAGLILTLVNIFKVKDFFTLYNAFSYFGDKEPAHYWLRLGVQGIILIVIGLTLIAVSIFGFKKRQIKH
jgi:Ni,Fe-hydrogenase I cytochrome b subunit